MRILILILAFGLVACSNKTVKETNVDRKANIDKAFVEYVEEYEKDFNASIIGISMGFKKLRLNKKTKMQTVGQCSYSANKTRKNRKIFIHKPTWLKYHTDVRRWLLYHEIAHCYENLAHRNYKLVDKCPASIMHKNTISKKCARKHWQYYKDELLYKYNNILWKKMYLDRSGGRVK